MSMIIHRCESCTHPHYQHARLGGGKCMYGYCFCAVTVEDVSGPPEIVPTFTPMGELVELIAPPGGTWNPGSTASLILCDCESCQALYLISQRHDHTMSLDYGHPHVCPV
jgi:hypothetical protein